MNCSFEDAWELDNLCCGCVLNPLGKKVYSMKPFKPENYGHGTKSHLDITLVKVCSGNIVLACLCNIRIMVCALY